MPAVVTLADGREHILRYPLRALKTLKVEHGLDLLRGGPVIGSALDDPEKLALILSIGLQASEPGITAEWVEDNVDASMLRDIAPMLIYAATGQWIELPEAPSKNGASSAGMSGQPTGSDSGLTDDTTSVSQSRNSGS